jgi:hypothetical protein
VEGQPRAKRERVLEAVLGDLPGFGQVGCEAELLVELDQAGENVRDQLAGDDPEVDLGRVEGRDLGDAEAEAEGTARFGLALLPGRPAEP